MKYEDMYEEVVVPKVSEEEFWGNLWEQVHPGIKYHPESHTVTFTDEACDYVVAEQKRLQEKEKEDYENMDEDLRKLFYDEDEFSDI